MSVLSLVPTPYWVLAPGTAVDLSQAVTVEGHAPPVDRFYLTDVTVQHPSTLQLLRNLLGGARIVRQETVIPKGIPGSLYDRSLVQAMEESQDTAAVVAERAAGFRVADAPTHLVVVGILPASPAAGLLHPGDEIVGVDGTSVKGLRQLTRAIAATFPGRKLVLSILRDGEKRSLQVGTMRVDMRQRIGIALERRQDRAALPIPVHYALGDIGGSSGGLMLALQIYSALRGDRQHRGTSIAGTGTLASDGTVGPIEGTVQKFIAAKRAGARIFFVPRENFADVSHERGVRIVPVGTFRDALAALPS